MTSTQAVEPELPASGFDSFLALASDFTEKLRQAKSLPPAPGLDWYPYDTMASLGHLSEIFKDHFEKFVQALDAAPVLDVGCGDGDLSVFLASLGHDVTSIDNPPTNYNRMQGVRALSERLGIPVQIVEKNVDSQFSLGDREYGVVLALGILYHLQNPYYFLNTLSAKARCCVLSTRVAVESKNGKRMDDEALAYLLDAGKLNDDASNYWIFSPIALQRLINRAGWSVLGATMVGCTEGSNPVDRDKDARMFMFLSSRLVSIRANVVLLDGWTEKGEFDWAWTLKRFSLRVTLLESVRPECFSLRFVVVDPLVSKSPVSLSCQINGIPAATQAFSRAGGYNFEAEIPERVSTDGPLLFEFSVDHEFTSEIDLRELGIVVPFDSSIRRTSAQIPFWLG